MTETAEVAADLDVAAGAWPGEPRSRLLLRLVRLGREALEQGDHDWRHQRTEAVEASNGRYGDLFAEDHLEQLRRATFDHQLAGTARSHGIPVLA